MRPLLIAFLLLAALPAAARIQADPEPATGFAPKPLVPEPGRDADSSTPRIPAPEG